MALRKQTIAEGYMKRSAELLTQNRARLKVKNVTLFVEFEGLEMTNYSHQCILQWAVE